MADPTVDTGSDNKPILLLAGGETLVWAGTFYLFPAMFIRWEQGFDWTKAELTGALTFAIIASAVCSPIAGRLIDRGFGAHLLAGSTLLGGLMVASLSLVQTLWQFYAVWLMIGMAMSGALYEPCFAFVTRALGKHAKRPITVITLVAGFASSISFPTAYGLGELFGWRITVLVFGLVVCLVAAPLLWFGGRTLEPKRHPENVSSEGSPSIADYGFLRRPEFWLIAMAFSFLALNHGVIINHLLPILADRGFQSQASVLVASMIGPMQVTGRLATMAAEKYVSSHWITFACFAAVALATLLLISASIAPMLVVGFVILQGAGYGVTSIMKPVVSREILGEANFGSISGALAVPYLAAFAGAVFLGSLFWEIGGYDFALSACMGFALAGATSYVLANHLHKRKLGQIAK